MKNYTVISGDYFHTPLLYKDYEQQPVFQWKVGRPGFLNMTQLEDGLIGGFRAIPQKNANSLAAEKRVKIMMLLMAEIRLTT